MCFFTLIGHQNNTLIMGPGGYKFGDYWRMGLLVEIFALAISVPLIRSCSFIRCFDKTSTSNWNKLN